MAWIHTVSVEGEAVKVLRFPHHWERPQNVDLFSYTNFTESETRAEDRSPNDSGLRLFVHIAILVKGDAAQEMREFLAGYASERIAVPMYCDAWAAADFDANRRFAPSYALNYDKSDPSSHTVHEVATGATPTTHPTSCPLHFGRLAKVEEAEVIDSNRKEAVYRLVIDDDAPDSMRVLAVDDSLAASWPVSLNKVESVEESYDIGEKTVSYGSRVEKAVENQEAAFRYGQGFRLNVLDGQIRELVNFWASMKGPWKAFTSPSFYNPGTATSTAPHGTKVRFSEERLRLAFTNRDVARASVEFIQLPWEITPERTYERPRKVWLYKFSYLSPTPVVVGLSSASESITAGGVPYTPGFIEPGKLSIDLKRFADGSVDIASHAEAGNPLMRFFPGPLQAPLTCEVYTCDPSDPDGTLQLILPGEVDRVKPSGRRLVATVRLFGGLLKQMVGDFDLGPDCKVDLFSPGCGLVEGDFEESGTIDSISANVVTVSTAAADAAGHFVDGVLEYGDGDDYQVREIVASTPGSGTQVLTLDEALLSPAAVSDSVTFKPGCNGTYPRCGDLGNAINFKGHPRGARENLTLKSFDHPNVTGKK